MGAFMAKCTFTIHCLAARDMHETLTHNLTRFFTRHWRTVASAAMCHVRGLAIAVFSITKIRCTTDSWIGGLAAVFLITCLMGPHRPCPHSNLRRQRIACYRTYPMGGPYRQL